MQLSRDDEHRSVLKTTETITADFPPNQNHGLARDFVKEYDDHPTNFKLISVTGENNKSLEYNWSDNQLRIGNSSEYVSGKNTYVITYTQRDITRFYSDTDKDEFYWDVIGVQWRVPIENASIELTIDNGISSSTQTDLRCYFGFDRVTDKCDQVTKDGDKYSIIVNNLKAGEGVSVALGFSAGTFSHYKQPWWEKAFAVWSMVQAVLMLIAILLTVVLYKMYNNTTGRKSELHPIAPEYIPPKDMSVAASAAIIKRYDVLKGSALTAQLLDLAVRHFIKIYQVKEKSLFSAAEYEIEVIKNIDTLKSEEQELLTDMFGEVPIASQRMNLKDIQNSMSYFSRTSDNDGKVDKLLEDEYAILEENPTHKNKFQRRVKIILICGILLLSPPLLIAALVLFMVSKTKSLTDKGLALRRYLEGLKMYIGVAEAERLKMLQSPEGALKIAESGVKDTNDRGQLVKLYERTLPYAVLFGQEKDWSKQIGNYYEQAGKQPYWYSGVNSFNAAMFVDGVSGLSTTTANASGYSASAGGSGGAGSAGGGGGGGGGGGW